MSDDVFKTGDKPGEEGSALEQLVGEGKKFATIEDLAKGKQEADAHIAKLEGEAELSREQLAELGKKAEKNVALSEIMEAVKNANKEGESEGKTLDEEALKELVKDVISGESEAQTKSDNRRAANQAVLDKLDGNVEAARAYVAEVAKENGMTVDQVQSLGETSPSAFRKLMGLEVPAHDGKGITPLPNKQPPTDNTGEVIDGHKTKAYYTRLKREMGAVEYWTDDALQKQYFKDAMALGERFNQ